MTFVLTAYPLSAAFRAQVAEPDAETVVVPELRRLGPAALLRRLRSLRGACVIAIEDPASAALLPVLELLAAATRAETIDVVGADLVPRPVGRGGALAAGAGLAEASVEAQLALRAARRDLDELARAPRSDAHARGDGILMVNPNLWFGVQAGGSITHVAGVANALAAEHPVRLATAVEPVGVSEQVAVTRLRPPRTFGLPVEANVYRFGRSLVAQLRGTTPPWFLYQRNAVGSYAGAQLSRRLGVPLVLEYNGSEVWAARHWGRTLRYEQLALDAENASLRHAHVVVTVSEVLRREVLERGVEEERVVTHPNGVDAERFDPARFSDDERRALRARYGIPENAVLATFVGTFGQWHGAEVFGQAIPRVGDERVRYLFVGDGLRAPETRRLVAGRDDVVFAGLVPQAEAPLHLAASDVLVSPHVPNADGSPFFGSPTKLFEYMAAGKAIVASDLDQIGDVIREVGVLVRPGDPDELAAALRGLARGPEQRAALSRAARERVLANYTWRHHVEAILRAVGGLY